MARGIKFSDFLISQILTICTANGILYLVSGVGLGRIQLLQTQKKPQEEQSVLSLFRRGLPSCEPHLFLFIDLDPKELVRVHPHHFLSLDDNQDNGPAAPLVVHHKLSGLDDTELPVIVFAPHDDALCRESVKTECVSH